jgi:hypothetical protein
MVDESGRHKTIGYLHYPSKPDCGNRFKYNFGIVDLRYPTDIIKSAGSQIEIIKGWAIFVIPFYNEFQLIFLLDFVPASKIWNFWRLANHTRKYARP